jgi:hypothetical protein
MVFGREEERARLEELLDCGRSSFSGLALEGAPGIGKTTLWRAAVADARQRGFRVIATAPAKPDAVLAFVEILVSQTVTDLVAGSGIRFEARGARELKGVRGSWPLNAVLRASSRASPAPAPSRTDTEPVGVGRLPPARSSA